MSRIYWDTMLFVYLIEDHPVFAPKVRRIHERMSARGDTSSTSTLTYGEALIVPLKGGDQNLAERMKRVFQSDEVELLPFLLTTAEICRYSRESRGIRSRCHSSFNSSRK